VIKNLNWQKRLKNLILIGITFVCSWQLLINTAIATEVVDLPDLPVGDRTWVADFANVISSSTEQTVTDLLDKLATDTGYQVRFVTVQRIDFGQPASEFVSELFDKWFPTPEQQQKQTLFLLATEDHRTAIKIGNQVVVPTDIATSIVSETMLFPAQKSNYNQSVADGATRLIAILTGQPDPGAPVVATDLDLAFKPAEIKSDPVNASVIVVGFLIAATVIPMVTYYWFQNQS
jgi:uncharacterized protein